MSTTDDILKEMGNMVKAEIEKSPSRKLQMIGYARRQEKPNKVQIDAGVKNPKD